MPVLDRRRILPEDLRERCGSRLHQVRLFGSYARGEANEDSDVDVLVVVDGLTDMEMFDVVSAATPVLLESGLPLAPLLMASEKLDEMRRRERLLARVLDDEGIRL
jgi:predicted nucleotidyltransferase